MRRHAGAPVFALCAGGRDPRRGGGGLPSACLRAHPAPPVRWSPVFAGLAEVDGGLIVASPLVAYLVRRSKVEWVKQ